LTKLSSLSLAAAAAAAAAAVATSAAYDGWFQSCGLESFSLDDTCH
jgi:hypothetical protein